MSLTRALTAGVISLGMLTATASYAQEAEDVDLLALPGEIVDGVTSGIGGTLNLGDSDEGNAACAQRFRSFDPESGTYVTYSGQRVTCPYLR